MIYNIALERLPKWIPELENLPRCLPFQDQVGITGAARDERMTDPFAATVSGDKCSSHPTVDPAIDNIKVLVVTFVFVRLFHKRIEITPSKVVELRCFHCLPKIVREMPSKCYIFIPVASFPPLPYSLIAPRLGLGYLPEQQGEQGR